jgi:hypothetical protein
MYGESMSNFKIKMGGTQSHLHYGPFEIERDHGSRMELPPSKYCYSFKYKENEVRIFEYQHEARHFLDALVTELREIKKKIRLMEKNFMEEYELPEFPVEK